MVVDGNKTIVVPSGNNLILFNKDVVSINDLYKSNSLPGLLTVDEGELVETKIISVHFVDIPKLFYGFNFNQSNLLINNFMFYSL